METTVSIWNLLWDYQVHLAVMLVLMIWLAVRGSDVLRWIIRLFHRLVGRQSGDKK